MKRGKRRHNTDDDYDCSDDSGLRTHSLQLVPWTHQEKCTAHTAQIINMICGIHIMSGF